MSGSPLLEILASLVHEIWIKWMEYLFTKGKLNDDGSFTIDPESVRRWKRQMETPYEALWDEEKESDRRQARKIIVLIDEITGNKLIV